jgi:unsaturated rhamnogalacturonyl hydrolase
MGIVEVLDFMPADTPGREQMIKILRDLYEVLPRYRDPETGMWYQVLDQPGREGNYVEATCSAMFTCVMLKGVRKGYLDASLADMARGTYRDLIKTFIREDADGVISLTRCCEVGGLGGKQNRDGSFEYYLSEPVRDNDPKGVGPFIWASLEHEGLTVND